MASKSSPWGAFGWWMILAISIPFALYAAVFVMGDFEVYKMMTLTWAQGKYDVAGLNILHHLRAWQIHAVAAELFIVTGPFQFSPSFRKKFPTIHRVMGYVFVAAGTVSSISGIFVLGPNTEFGRFARVVFTIQGFALLYHLFIAVKMAKAKKFQIHQRYMIRAAATGYAVVAMRPFPAFFIAIGLPIPLAMELAVFCAVALFVGIAELYIQRVLLEPKVTTSTNGVQYVQTSATEEPEAIQCPNTNEVKNLRTDGPQTGLGSSKPGGWVGGNRGQGGESASGFDPLNPQQNSNGNKSVKPPIASASLQDGHPQYWSSGTTARASQQFRTTSRFRSRFSKPGASPSLPSRLSSQM